MDFLLGDDLDLVISGGDFAIERDSVPQEARSILVTSPGNWKQSPLVGVGEAEFVNGRLDAALRRAVSLQLQADGKRLRRLSLTPEGTLQVEVE